jgi:hypothetical protein
VTRFAFLIKLSSTNGPFFTERGKPFSFPTSFS